MVGRRKPPGEAAASYAPVLNTALQATTASVQAMHQAIAGKTFDSLQLVPGLAVPTRIVQGVHDAISQGVYAAVRHGGGAAFALAGGVERFTTDSSRQPQGKELAVRSALNAAMGDRLEASGSPLAVQMGLFADGAPLDVSKAALAHLPARVCLFIHGLACDEQSWNLRSDAWGTSPWAGTLTLGAPIRYGALLHSELGIGSLYLRYNTGVAIEPNAQQLAALLTHVARAAPQVREWVLVGHSMGGLVARAALALARSERLAWAARAPMLVCLGSPHQGAPLEKIGHLTTAALGLSKVTQPLGRIANARSQGIKDLRQGLKGRSVAASTVHGPEPAPVALRFVSATLGDAGDRVMGPLIGKLFGDGLVMASSASDEGLLGDVLRVEIKGIGHMALLNHPRVYAVLREWLGAPALA
jgi:pimeloyl-ACP methyl ester carboxylesterase